MTPIEVLNRFKAFTEREVASKILMMKEPAHTGDIWEDYEAETEYVHPKVEIGTIPHKNFQPLNFTVPMILWTFDEVDDEGVDTEGRTISVRANIGAYSSSLYADGDTPDNKAFLDLSNALEQLYIALSRKMIVDGVGIVKPISYGIYDGAYYPYCYGWLEVTARIPKVIIEDIDSYDIEW